MCTDSLFCTASVTDAKAPCTGVEVAAQSSWELEISEQAAMLGGACTKKQDVAKMFRYLGIDG